MRKTKIVSTLEGINPEWKPVRPLTAGKRYKVSWGDCCTSGFFYGTFQGYRLVPNVAGGEPEYPETAVFVEGHEADANGFSAREVE